MNGLPWRISWLMVPPRDGGVNAARRQINLRKKGASIAARPFLYFNCTRNCAPLLTATAADHLEIGYRKMAVFIGVVLSLLFGLFLGVVHFLMVHGARHAYGVAHMICQAAILALQFPSRAVIRHQLVLAPVLLQAARQFANLAGIVISILRSVRETCGWQQRQPRKSEKAQC